MNQNNFWLLEAPDASAYLRHWRCLFSGPIRGPRQWGGKGPAGPLSGCRTDPRSCFGSSWPPQTLQHQLYSDLLLLSPDVSRDQAVDDLHPAEWSLGCLVITPRGRICTDSSTDRWHCRPAWNTRTGTPPHSGILTHARRGPLPGVPRLASPNTRQLSAAGCRVSPGDWGSWTTVSVCVYCPVRVDLVLSTQRTALWFLRRVTCEPARDVWKSWALTDMCHWRGALDVTSTCDSLHRHASNCFDRQCCEFEESHTSWYKIRNGVNMFSTPSSRNL